MSALRLTAAVVALGLAVVACGEDERPPGVPDSSMSLDPVFASPAPAATASSQLLTFEDIGAGFVPVPYEPSEPSVAAPCGGPAADSVWPPNAIVGAEADLQAASVQVVEELRVYGDDATAAAGFDALVAELACPTATLVGPVASVVVTVGPAADVSALVGVPATRIDVTAAEFTGSIVVARSAQTVATFEVFAPPASPNAPDPVAVAAKGVAKLR